MIKALFPLRQLLLLAPVLAVVVGPLGCQAIRRGNRVQCSDVAVSSSEDLAFASGYGGCTSDCCLGEPMPLPSHSMRIPTDSPFEEPKPEPPKPAEQPKRLPDTRAGLHASVEGIEESAAVGGSVQFRVTITNQGRSPISSVKTTVRLSDNARSVQGTPGGRATGNVVEFITEDFPSGSREYRVQAEVANRGDGVVRATIQVESPLLTAGPIVGDAVVPIPQP